MPENEKAEPGAAVRLVGSAVQGLSTAEVAERVAAGQTNAFVQDTSRSVWSIVRANVLTLFNGIILACFIVLFAIGRWQDALFGFSAIANAVIGSVQEYRAKRALDRLALLNAPHARVMRDGSEAEIALDDVVLDDTLVLRAGDQVPADGVVAASRGLQVDESMLTGESDAVEKTEDDRVLSGSVVVAGEGTAVVDRVGADSFANSLAAEAKRFSLVASELRSSIDRVLKWVTWFVGPVALLVLNAQMLAQGGWAAASASGAWRDAATATIAAVVAMVPLGLVLMTSITFAVGAVKLARQQVLVQELPAVEGLARVDIICLDKTGTLTQGDIVFDAARPLAAVPGWESVLAWYGVQKDANATARSLAGHFTELPADQPSDRVPFSSARKWSAVIFDDGMWILGGPEMVFPERGSDDAGQQQLASQAAELAATGRRTLVLAHGTPTHDETVPADAVPVALLTFKENIRPDAAETLTYFAAQDVDVRIISGDNPRTVAAIAREVGLDAPHGFDARELPDDDQEFLEVINNNVVFGRVSPDQKKRIVLALKAAGRTVAMTGDGVNDALAIKEADIGVAMNSGAAATKAVARLVLLDGKFSHLPSVVAEGRQVIANIERVSMLFLTKTAYATFLAIAFGILLLPFPFLPRQLSVTDGLTIGIPAFFLALLPNAQRYIPGFLRRSLTFAVPAGVSVTLGLAAYAKLAANLSIPEAEIRTGSTLILAIIGIWILVVLSRPVTRFKGLVIGAMMVGLVLVYSVRFARDFLQFTDPTLPTALLVLATSVACIGLIEIVRFVHRRVAYRDAEESRQRLSK
ncbi:MULTISPECIES: HAD-IC family P-type ATPase [Paenarthrobacter]|uniref:HAD-IC family P-type ATPase n=1 Tax=Paenarthrobacter TaxID=1742992 RepID=UPI00057EBB50|nr:HAD-IC family P-type ATPase [Paenarthrobacter nicotinovorans]KIA71376.1 cation-transporting ATPase E1-E2 family [Arthrobacter sp. MWB30]MBP2395127.1 cation-transporting ATPase E [Paenarthrobacter nicotinovorans]UKE98724.1 HAD-IC family P-type ATPase [Paenarthrobacter nicotinovorans]UKF03513.1 HAD-IC family P-type ATPase [Paenarthrobacter nicotinovorans]GGV36856.1 magnesium-transporting ATPase [Paenarthrobacter nicotinovorans]